MSSLVHRTSRRGLLGVVLVGSALLAGCAGPAVEPEPEPTDDIRIHVVASTDIYADIAQQIGGEYVEVTTVVDDPAQDPATFVPDPDDQALAAAIAAADVFVVNGGGYDDAVAQLFAVAGAPRAVTIVAAAGRDDLAGLDPHIWFSNGVIGSVANNLAIAYEDLDPARDFSYSTKAEIFAHWLSLAGTNAARVGDLVEGMSVVTTDSAAFHLLDLLGLVDVTPDAPDQTAALVAGGSVDFVFHDPQTSGPAVDAVLSAAAQQGVPVIEVGETIPADVVIVDDDFTSRFVWWQVGILSDIHQGLDDAAKLTEFDNRYQ